MRPLLDLREPENRETAAHVADIRRSLGKTTCSVVDLLASEPDRAWSVAHVAQQCRMLKPVAKLTLHTLATQGLCVRTRDRYQVTQLGLTVAR